MQHTNLNNSYKIVIFRTTFIKNCLQKQANKPINKSPLLRKIKLV